MSVRTKKSESLHGRFGFDKVRKKPVWAFLICGLEPYLLLLYYFLLEVVRVELD